VEGESCLSRPGQFSITPTQRRSSATRNREHERRVTAKVGRRDELHGLHSPPCQPRRSLDRNPSVVRRIDSVSFAGGYSYGVSSNASLLRQSGTIIASGGVQTDKTKESAAEFVTELKNLAGAKPITETELTAARLTKIRGYAQQFESLNRVSGQVINLWALGMPMIELQREPESLLGASLAAVNAAASKYAAPAGTTLLLVGDRSKIEAGLKDLNAGEVVVLDVEARRVK
jgi:hypothetical protein